MYHKERSKRGERQQWEELVESEFEGHEQLVLGERRQGMKKV